jgi:hypothetical protein
MSVNILPLRWHLVNAGGSDAEGHVCRESFETRQYGRSAVPVHRIDELAEEAPASKDSGLRKFGMSRMRLLAKGLRFAPIEGIRRDFKRTNR